MAKLDEVIQELWEYYVDMLTPGAGLLPGDRGGFVNSALWKSYRDNLAAHIQCGHWTPGNRGKALLCVKKAAQKAVRNLQKNGMHICHEADFEESAKQMEQQLVRALRRRRKAHGGGPPTIQGIICQ